MKKVFAAAALFVVMTLVVPNFVAAQSGPTTIGGSVTSGMFNSTGPTVNNGPLLQQVGASPISYSAATPGFSACGNLTATGLSGVSGCIIGILDNLVVLLMAAAVLVVVWGAFQMIYSEEKRAAGKETVIYGIIGLFVMLSIWGFVNILQSTFNLRGSFPSQLP